VQEAEGDGATESTCTRTSGLISEPRWIRQDRNDLIPAFNPGFYLRLDIRLHIVGFSFPPFLLSKAMGTLPRNRLIEFFFVPSFFLQKLCVLSLSRKILSSKLSINRITYATLLILFCLTLKIKNFVLLQFH